MKLVPFLKHCVSAFGFALLSLSTTQATPLTPVLHYEFNEPGAIQYSSGSTSLAITTFDPALTPVDLIGDAPKPRAGAAGQKALDFTAATAGSSFTSNRVTFSSAAVPALAENLDSFTVTLWIYGNEPASMRRLFFLSGGSSHAIDFRIGPSATGDAVLSLAVAGSGAASSDASSVFVPANNDAWYFVAVSYDAATGAVVFYSGEEGDHLASSSATLLNGGTPYVLPKNSTRLDIGNSSPTDDRRVNAYLSDVRFYDSVLDINQLNTIYAIPEPSTVALFGGCAALFLLSALTRK